MALPSAAEQRGLAEAVFVELPVQELVLLLPAVVAAKHGNETDRVEALRRLRAAQFGRRREQVAEVPHVRRLDARAHRARPPGNRRHADAAVGQAPLDAAERTRRLEARQLMARLVVRSVVARE